MLRSDPSGAQGPSAVPDPLCEDQYLIGFFLASERALSLCSAPGHDLFQQPLLAPVGSAQPWPEPPALSPVQAPSLRQGCFYLLVLVPITCALLQLFTWSQFTLHGSRLHMIKAQRQSLAQAQALDVKTV